MEVSWCDIRNEPGKELRMEDNCGEIGRISDQEIGEYEVSEKLEPSVIKNKVASCHESCPRLQALNVLPRNLLIILENVLLPGSLGISPNPLKLLDVGRSEVY